MKIERIQTPEPYSVSGHRVDRRLLSDGIEITTERAVAPDQERHKNREYPQRDKDREDSPNTRPGSHDSGNVAGHETASMDHHLIDLVV